MKTIVQYFKMMCLAFLFLFMMQGCSFYMGLHVKSAPQSDNRTVYSGILNERGAVETASNQDLKGEK